MFETEKHHQIMLNLDTAKNTIIMSIHPQWVDLIRTGKKTYEVRKSIPTCDYPIRVLIYCTKAQPYSILPEGAKVGDEYVANGKIIGEFIVFYPFTAIRDEDKFNPSKNQKLNQMLLQKSCLTYEQLMAYVGNSRVFHFLQIHNLVIYDKPMTLYDIDVRLKKAPQSWCYVERY